MLKLFVAASGSPSNSRVCFLTEPYFFKDIHLLLDIEKTLASQSFTDFILLLLLLFLKLLNEICGT